ncbi:MAG TPA: DUF167 domain-containing protein [bacterium]|nr:DUF167 domain-containing protein [bacterium]HOL67977.1 DUF167 domain-containing protein [bacterium]HPP11369.1 DUF167 domain-containing protein [bacterium]
MKVSVTVKPYARQARVIATDQGLIVYVDAAPVEGKANRRLLELCARHFGVARSQVRICHGTSGRHKILEIS